MKRIGLALVALPLLASSAIAESSERSVFEPLSATSHLDAAGVDRADSGQVAVAAARLRPAGVQDVDRNGDGEIGFEELLAHDLNPGF